MTVTTMVMTVGVSFFQAEDGIRDYKVTGVQTCALPISDVPGAGASSLPISNIVLMLPSVSSANAGDYTLIVSNAYGSLTSAVASVIVDPPNPRSEERRVGKECRSRWSPYH